MPAGSTNFPTSLDSNTVATGATEITSTGYNNHSVQVEAIQAKVGVDGSAVTASHSYKLSEVTSSDKAVGKTATQTLTNKTLASPVISTPTFSDGDIVPKNLVTGTGTSWVWQSWTPTWTNFTTGDGTLDIAKYIQIGKLVVLRLKFTLGSTSAMGTAPTFSLPVTAVTGIDTTNNIIGTASFVDPDTITAQGFGVIASTTTALLRVAKTDATYLTHSTLSATLPFTWNALDRIHINAYYEAA